MANEAEWAVWRSIDAMHRMLVRSVESRLQSDANISGPEFEVLISLLEAREGSLRNGDLAVVLDWERSRVSHQVSRMIARGLVTRRVCATDLRGTWVTITEEGTAAVRAAMPERLAVMRELLFDNLSPSELEVLRTASEKVLSATQPSVCAQLRRGVTEQL